MFALLPLTAWIVLASQFVQDGVATGQRYTPSPTQDLDNTLQSVPPLGPNVCRSRYKNYCCPGWSKKLETGLCVIPICARRCGSVGRCIRPNICLCEGGVVASSCGNGQSKGETLPDVFQFSIYHHPVITHENGSGGDRGDTGRCRVHCINGNCVDGRCQCRSGYQGEF